MNLYIELFHGRKDPERDMDDWGDDGPVFGPFRFVHTTYARHIKLGLPLGGKCEVANLFVTKEDLVYYDGMYYGDWSVFGEDTFNEPGNYRQRLVEFDQSKTRL